jgi:hypothetical protein
MPEWTITADAPPTTKPMNSVDVIVIGQHDGGAVEVNIGRALNPKFMHMAGPMSGGGDVTMTINKPESWKTFVAFCGALNAALETRCCRPASHEGPHVGPMPQGIAAWSD